MQRVKLAIIHNTITPYRHPLFEALSQNLDLIVYYCSVKHSSRKWDLWPRNYNYKYKILPRIPLKTPLGDNNLNLSIITELVLNKPHVLILSDYTDPTIWLALAVAKLLKIPLIYWTEGIKEPQSILGKISRPLRTLFIKKSDSIIVPGSLSRKYVISLGADPKKVFNAPNAIDDELFGSVFSRYISHKEELKHTIGCEGKTVILFVGRLVKEKGILFLLEAYRKLRSENRDIALVMVGHGKLYDTIQKICQKDNIGDVILTGAIQNSVRLIKYYSMSDMFVLPTLTDVWGFVINEVMVCELPVVSTYASQAACEMVRSGINGYVVKEGSSEELYAALKKLICNAKRRKEMGQRSRDIVSREFSVRLMTDGFLSAIKCSTSRK